MSVETQDALERAGNRSADRDARDDRGRDDALLRVNSSEGETSADESSRSSPPRARDTARDAPGDPPTRSSRPSRWRTRWTLGRIRRGIGARLSSPLTKRILVLNLGGLLALLVGFLYLSQLREGLIAARIQTLQTQGEIIAAAIASSASVQTDAITLDPDKLLKLLPGEKYPSEDEPDTSLDFSINPERVGPVLRRLVSPTKTRARVYDREGYMLVDSRSLADRSTILRFDLPPEGNAGNAKPGVFTRAWNAVKSWLFGSSELPRYKDIGIDNGRFYPEVRSALGGKMQSVVRANERGETIITTAVPVQRFRVVRGALLLSTQGGDIDNAIIKERWGMVRLFLVFAGVMFVLSLLLAGQIAEPIRRLAEGAERVRRGIKSRHEIPDFTKRPDEVGHLSGALRDMTEALYNRIEAIESFAADVAHELKNPLTSLRSAVETLPIAKTEESRARLLDVIQHDVRRLDRLISDISNASRLDAELARGDTGIVDLVRLLNAVTTMGNEVQRDDGVNIRLHIVQEGRNAKDGYHVLGHDSRLGQVITNLIENARSFSPKDGTVDLTMQRSRGKTRAGRATEGVEILVDDYGPGIANDAFEKIFERFYTDRPNQGFGQNSGLGLSISRQIIQAHNGHINAMNRTDPKTGEVTGARFSIWLPARKS